MLAIEIIRPAASVAVVALHGEYDAVSKVELGELLSDEINDNELVVVDVTDAEFVDSSFLHNLVKADQLAVEHGSRFVLQMGTSHIVRRAIEISGILHRLDWVSSREEALANSVTRRRGGPVTSAPELEG